MKFKDILFLAALGLLIMYAYQYFLGGKPQEGQPGAQVFTVSHADPDLVAPLDHTIDFMDARPDKGETQTSLVETEYGQFSFTTDGAAIDHIQFKRIQNDRIKWFDTFTATSKERRVFMLALNEKTPFFYRLVDRQDHDDREVLTYNTPFEQGTLTKEYTVYKKVHKVDVKVTVDLPKDTNKPVRLRLMFPSPKLVGLCDNFSRVFFQEQSGSVRIYTDVKEITNQFFGGPLSLFGLEDRYFAYSLISDANQFTHRAYVQDLSTPQHNPANQQYLGFLQSRWIKEPTTWTMSFYLGPKDPAAIGAVDSRLDAILDFGWFSWFAKLLLAILNWLNQFVHNYGLAIILFTVLLKLLFLPITWRAEAGKGAGKKKQQDLQRKMALLKEKYKDDPQGLQQAQAELIRKHGIPGLGGACLPALLQIPIFIGLNSALRSSIELYQVPFLWISNLAAKDPYYILPIFTGIVMALHVPAGMGASKDPKQQLMPYFMALAFGAFMVSLPAGVVLFIGTSTALGVIQARIYKLFNRS